MAEKQQKKKKGRSVQELLGIRTFTKYGLAVGKYELLFYLVAPTNISVLSHTNIEIKIRHLMMVLSAIPDIEITCTDSSECFDDNKAYLTGRLAEEHDPKVRKIIEKDIDHLDHIQMEMATARQFLFMARLKNTKDKQVFDAANRIEKTISEQGFEVHRMAQHASPPKPRSEKYIGRCRSHRRNGAGRQSGMRCQSSRRGSLSAARTRAVKPSPLWMTPMCIV